MGNTNSNRRTKEQVKDTKETRNKLKQMRIDEINHVQTTLMTQSIEKIRTGSNQEALETMENIQKINNIVEKSKQQLDREGKPLTKADLIAIIIALEPQSIPQMEKIQSNSISDLNALIRIIIYDPNRYMNQPSKKIALQNQDMSIALMTKGKISSI